MVHMREADGIVSSSLFNWHKGRTSAVTELNTSQRSGLVTKSSGFYIPGTGAGFGHIIKII